MELLRYINLLMRIHRDEGLRRNVSKELFLEYPSIYLYKDACAKYTLKSCH